MAARRGEGNENVGSWAPELSVLQRYFGHFVCWPRRGGDRAWSGGDGRPWDVGAKWRRNERPRFGEVLPSTGFENICRPESLRLVVRLGVRVLDNWLRA